ncbi:MAG: XrtA system polysaccharide deacetylase [Planctomycetota bacterium]
MTRHALTVDVEDWYQVENLRRVAPPERWGEFESRLRANMDTLLELLDRRGVKATCFVLGAAAARDPSVVRSIVERGHELGCHGWSHELVYRQDAATFRAETRRAKAALEDAAGSRVDGYRASTFSITERSLWALDVLAEEGFVYDSSIAPLRHDRYGIPTAPLDPHVRVLSAGRSIAEYPVSVMRVCGLRLPLGGGFFRLLPLRWTQRALDAYAARGASAMLYLHPWELDPGQPRVRGLGTLRRFRHYANLSGMRRKLDRLLQSHRFATIREAFRAAALPEARTP